MKDASVKILDEKYIIQVRHEEQDPKLKECDGYTDTTIKRIVICDRRSDDKMQVENPEVVISKVLRHEMIHAFLYESGLSIHSWADDEEIVDWIAIQFPRLMTAFDTAYTGITEDDTKETNREYVIVSIEHSETKRECFLAFWGTKTDDNKGRSSSGYTFDLDGCERYTKKDIENLQMPFWEGKSSLDLFKYKDFAIKVDDLLSIKGVKFRKDVYVE